MRVLEGNAEISTRYGGGFVQSIDGVEEAERGGRSLRLVLLRRRGRVADRRRRLLAAGRRADLVGLPRLVGDRPRARRGRFLAGAVRRRLRRQAAPGGGRVRGRGRGLRGRCAGRWRRPASTLAAGSPDGAIRVLVGPWARLRSDPAAALIEAGPAGKRRLRRLRAGAAAGYCGRPRRGRRGRRAPSAPTPGLVAATRRYEAPPVWVVTGGDAAGVQAAAGLLDAADLRDHYAVASEDGKETPLPVPMR